MENKKLYLSSKDVKVAGVLGGLGEYLDTDPTAIRVLYVLLTIFTGIVPGLIAYLFMWAVIPKRPLGL